MKLRPYFMDELALNAAGYRATGTRLQLVELIRRHPRSTTTALLPHLRQQRIGHKALYRNIEVLEQAGLIMRILAAGEVQLVPQGHPDHNTGAMQCLRCHCQLPFQSSAISRSVAKELGSKQWRQVGYQLQIKGICRSCQIGVRPMETRL